MELSTSSPGRKKLKVQTKVIQPKWQRIVLLSVLAYEALGCLSGGSLLVGSPDGRLMNMPVEIMHGAFDNFLVPGIILLGLGILNTVAFFTVLYRNKFDWFMSALALGGLLIWFWVEITILGELHWLHAMWGLPVILGSIMALSLLPFRQTAIQKALFISGILSSVVYLVANIVCASLYEGYSSVSLSVSELSAIDAPTRPLWISLTTIYSLLVIAFGWGIWQSSMLSRRLKTVGILFIAYAVIGFFWPPMHQRQVLAAGGGTISDTLHIAFTFVTVPLMMLAIGIGASAFDKKFRIYSFVTLAILITAGIITGVDAPNISKNLPTPWLGVWERINIGVYMLWVVVLAIMLLQNIKKQKQLMQKELEGVTRIKQQQTPASEIQEAT